MVTDEELAKIAERMERVVDRVRKHLGQPSKRQYLIRALDSLDEANQEFEKIVIKSERSPRSYLISN